jgi:hypothetical protein
VCSHAVGASDCGHGVYLCYFDFAQVARLADCLPWSLHREPM